MTLRTHLDGTVFADHQAGADPAVLALHGWGRDRADIAAVAGGRACIAFDLPGFGASPPPPGVWGASDYARAVAAALDESGEARRWLVVGHSFGGRIATCLAVERPDLVGGVVFLGVPLLRLTAPSAPPLWFRAARSAHARKVFPEGQMEKLRRRRGSDDYNAASGIMRDVLVKAVNESYEDQLRAMACPVGFCWGASDPAAPAEIATKASGIVRHLVGVDIVDGVAHDVHRQAPDRVQAMIDSVAGAGGPWS